MWLGNVTSSPYHAFAELSEIGFALSHSGRLHDSVGINTYTTDYATEETKLGMRPITERPHGAQARDEYELTKPLAAGRSACHVYLPQYLPPSARRVVPRLRLGLG